jgi:hypothetical protein
MCKTHNNCKLASWDTTTTDFMGNAIYSPKNFRSPSNSHQMIECTGMFCDRIYIISMLLPSEMLDFSANRISKIVSNWKDYFA